VVAFATWMDLFRKASRSGSLSKGLKYFIKPPGWSHEGATQTTREMIAEYNRHHPQEPIE
jgi:hypothetical protein